MQIRSIWLLALLMRQNYAYFAGESRMSWEAALNYCESQGSSLASIHSIEDFNEAKAVCDALIAQKLNSYGCWTGLNNRAASNQYVWADGTASDYGFNNGNPSSPISGHPWYQTPNTINGAANIGVLMQAGQYYHMRWNLFGIGESNVYPMCNDIISYTQNPTEDPTAEPTYNPTFIPTNDPSNEPTSLPTKSPTYNPTYQPIYHPTLSPTYTPNNPTIIATVNNEQELIESYSTTVDLFEIDNPNENSELTYINLMVYIIIGIVSSCITSIVFSIITCYCWKRMKTNTVNPIDIKCNKNNKKIIEINVPKLSIEKVSDRATKSPDSLKLVDHDSLKFVPEARIGLDNIQTTNIHSNKKKKINLNATDSDKMYDNEHPQIKMFNPTPTPTIPSNEQQQNV